MRQLSKKRVWRGYVFYFSRLNLRLRTVGVTLTTDSDAPLYFKLDLYSFAIVATILPDTTSNFAGLRSQDV